MAAIEWWVVGWTRRHWEFGHAVSAILDLIAFALIASVLFETSMILQLPGASGRMDNREAL